MNMISKFSRYGINNTFRFDNRVFLGKGEQMKSFSVEFIFRVDSFNTYVPIIWSTATNNNTYLAYHVPGKYFYNPTRYGAASEDTMFPFDIKLGKTYHMVYVIDETGGKMYIDGVFVAQNGNKSYIWNHLIDGSELFSGSTDKTEGWTGNIYSFRVFNYAMNADTARRLWNTGQPMSLNLQSQINPIGVITSATVEKINKWIGDLTRNEDGSVTVTNGDAGSYMGCAIRGSEGNMNGLKAENLGTYRITMTYMSDKPVQVRDLGATRMNQAFFSATNGEKKTETHVVQFDSRDNNGTPLNFYIYINPYAEGDEFTIYDFKAEQVGMLSEVLGKNMTTNMVRDTANVAETGGVKEVIPAQHLINLEMEPKEVLFSDAIPHVSGNMLGSGTIEKQPDGTWLVDIVQPASESPGSRPVISLNFGKNIEIEFGVNYRLTVVFEPTTDTANKKNICNVWFLRSDRTTPFYVYTSSEQVYGDQLNNESTAQVGSVNLYLVSSNAPFQVKLVSMKLEKLGYRNNAKLAYENPYNPVYVRTFNGAAVNNGDATEIVNNQDGTFTISQTGKDSQGRSTYVLHSFTAIPTTAGKEYDVTLQWTSPDIAKTLTRIIVLSGISFPIQLTGNKNSVTARITAIQSSISSLSVYPEDNDTPLEFTIKNITVKEVL